MTTVMFGSLSLGITCKLCSLYQLFTTCCVIICNSVIGVFPARHSHRCKEAGSGMQRAIGLNVIRYGSLKLHSGTERMNTMFFSACTESYLMKDYAISLEQHVLVIHCRFFSPCSASTFNLCELTTLERHIQYSA